MKHLTRLFLSGIVAIALLSCNKNNDSAKIKDRTLTVKNLSHSDCKLHTTKVSTDNSEYIEYSTVDANYLLIKYVNVSLNCCPDSIKVISRVEDGKIKYSIFEKTPWGCNCNCLYDVSCRIGPLEYAIYPIKIIVGPEQVAEFTIFFNSSTNGRFTIKKLSE